MVALAPSRGQRISRARIRQRPVRAERRREGAPVVTPVPYCEELLFGLLTAGWLPVRASRDGDAARPTLSDGAYLLAEPAGADTVASVGALPSSMMVARSRGRLLSCDGSRTRCSCRTSARPLSEAAIGLSGALAVRELKSLVQELRLGIAA